MSPHEGSGYNSDESDEMIPSPDYYATCSEYQPPLCPPGFMDAGPPRPPSGGAQPDDDAWNQNDSAFFWTQLQREESQLAAVPDAELLAPDEHGKTALHQVACIGKRALGYAIARRMAAANRLDLKDSDGMTPLLHAAKHNHHLMVADLILLGADVNEANHSGKTCLHLSAEKGYTRVLEVLKNAMLDGVYVDVEATDNSGTAVLLVPLAARLVDLDQEVFDVLDLSLHRLRLVAQLPVLPLQAVKLLLQEVKLRPLSQPEVERGALAASHLCAAVLFWSLFFCFRSPPLGGPVHGAAHRRPLAVPPGQTFVALVRKAFWVEVVAVLGLHGVRLRRRRRLQVPDEAVVRLGGLVVQVVVVVVEVAVAGRHCLLGRAPGKSELRRPGGAVVGGVQLGAVLAAVGPPVEAVVGAGEAEAACDLLAAEHALGEAVAVLLLQRRALPRPPGAALARRRLRRGVVSGRRLAAPRVAPPRAPRVQPRVLADLRRLADGPPPEAVVVVVVVVDVVAVVVVVVAVVVVVRRRSRHFGPADGGAAAEAGQVQLPRRQGDHHGALRLAGAVRAVGQLVVRRRAGGRGAAVASRRLLQLAGRRGLGAEVVLQLGQLLLQQRGHDLQVRGHLDILGQRRGGEGRAWRGRGGRHKRGQVDFLCHPIREAVT
ncbi:NF-kappa-B inhibitor zeta [Liparis tanakae]|uniref:NF-kappa-B inhibitor zeta n=1 Tax=Liparis tanakae TaxID=230148 RepID=A0A4Z2EXN9_9TELE|nr:NF-kappa-B inhibitor zeta [Liparis tanakae]